MGVLIKTIRVRGENIMAEDKIKVDVVPQVEIQATEKYGFAVEEVDAIVEIGDVVEMSVRGEVIEKRDGMVIFRKTGKAKRQGEVSELTLEEMKNKLPQARR